MINFNINIHEYGNVTLQVKNGTTWYEFIKSDNSQLNKEYLDLYYIISIFSNYVKENGVLYVVIALNPYEIKDETDTVRANDKIIEGKTYNVIY
ncbi:MAG: hypothetical protein HFJ35_02225 [Clostridia bacterium]|nr:hypothetical protein [Clostridia bacterium]